ncbi:outer membrane protein assembly factor [Paracoccus sediminis]|uniref:Autotransporter secretion outer membrane protein TamA n=1 Tax=Paracoccus sediminis TaxID=1214787 RepID=A0A238VHZ2_9RHOB|nr:autotransporter assembly complex family protein [Paracoccus sediminis]TBN52031.1 outer membrane protein assembly factor [Paracoccus sediminis]SNR33109.1 autotransporter secretion outer membrane protein TamA [Paracoccus sediminis]
MRAYLRAVLVAVATAGVGGAVWAQSSSPFSGLFGRSDDEGPVSLRFQVQGGDGLDRTLRNASLIAGALSEDRTTGQDVLAAARADYARILGNLYDRGYYSAIINITLDGVEAAEIAPLDAPAMVRQVVVSVQTGPQFRFSRAAIAPVAPRTDLPAEYRQGQVAGTGIIRNAARAGVEGWRDVGHAKADVTGQDITADHVANVVDSRIALSPGPSVTFGRLNLRGYDRMNPRRLAKIAGLPEGERFDPEEIEDVRKRLRRSGVFSAITLEESETLNPDGSMDINLTVVEQKPRRVGAGFEISTTDGAMVSAYWMHRNLLGGGERLRIEGEVKDMGSDTSGRDDLVTFRIDRPATITPDTTAYVLTSLSREREEDYDADTGTVGLGFNHVFSDRFTFDTAIQYQFSRVYDDLGETDFQVLALPTAVMWDARDDENNARRGYYLQGEATPFKGFDGTDSGVRLLGEGRAFYSLGAEDRLTLAGRARLGSVLGSAIQNTPRNYLFYSGGGGTVRGQPYQSLGVEEIQGPNGPIKTGGASVATLSAEVRWQVRERIGVVAFADYGQVWAEDGWGGTSDDHSGAGIGVRYNTPIGPLRFDVAGPAGGDTGNGVQLYLGLGQAF